jgi:hypothetical protein
MYEPAVSHELLIDHSMKMLSTRLNDKKKLNVDDVIDQTSSFVPKFLFALARPSVPSKTEQRCSSSSRENPTYTTKMKIRFLARIFVTVLSIR